VWRLVHLSDYILQQSVFFRKTALNVVGEIREDLHYIMDWDILIRLGKQFDFVYVPEYLGSLREYQAAKTFSGGLKRVREIRKTLQAHTGVLVPAGYVVYGLSTYAQVWRDYVNRLPPVFESLKAPLIRLGERLAHRVLGHVATHGQGLYADGWMSEKAFLMLRRGTGEIAFSGELPDVRELHGQVITISCDGKRCARRSVSPGNFDVCFPAPRTANDRAVTIKVEFEKSFVPKKIGISADRRKLSMIFREIRWTDAAAVHPLKGP